MNLEKKDFCCDAMHFHLIGSDQDGCELHFGYNPRWRSYFIEYKKNCGGGNQRINNCPWCGAILPTPLDNEYDVEISKILNLSLDDLDSTSYKSSKIPPEFKTDEWWKKRGL
jgi:hypothetical protein